MRPTSNSVGFNETSWNRETKNLTKLSDLLLQDLQRIETLFCLELNESVNLFDEVRRFEMNLITTALLHTDGSQRRSAGLLGISPSRLCYKMKIFGITSSDPVKP